MSKSFVVQKKDKDKKIPYSLLIIVLVIVVGVVALIVSNDKGLGKSRVKEISYQKYQEKIKDDEYTIVLITRDGCTHCISYKPSVNAIAKKYNLSIYELNVESLSMDEFITLHDNASIFKDVYDEGSPIIQTPGTILYKNGVEVDATLGDRGQDGFKNFLIKNGVVN